jgi:hypothetical protein
MGTPVRATLAFGYDLGNMGGSPLFEAPWWDDDSGEEAPVQVFDALYAAIPEATGERNQDERQAAAVKHFGVDIEYSGTDSFEGWLLVAVGSDQEVRGAGVLALSLHDLSNPPREWVERLAAAVAVLGLTPEPAEPQWLVFPTLG